MSQVLATVGIVFAAWLAHELGHLAVAYAAGWKVVRIAVPHPWLAGVGIAFDTRGRADQIRMVALGGPFVSLILTLLGLAVTPALWEFACINAAVLFFNLLPFRPFDGGYLWRAPR